MIDLTKKPFNLNASQILWVNETLNEMNWEEKIGQLFCPIGFSTDKNYLNSLISEGIGGLFFRAGNFDEMKETFDYAQTKSKIPLLVPANLEYGGNGAILEGTAYGTPLAVAASQKVENAYRLGKISAEEGKEVGINWSFAPVVDIDLHFKNPITNVRTYGDNALRIGEFAKAYTKAFHDVGMMTSAKHFPGDGVDDRDQHLLTSINTLSKEQWNQTFGKVYQEVIDDGVKSIMIGHIALPSYSGNKMPATLEPTILQGLLREELGFNGLAITDATPMVGFACAMKRSESVPLSIEYGCDMFLFNKDFKEDLQYMREGFKNGLLSEKRLNEAVTRILATKASLNLHLKVEDKVAEPPKAEFAKWSQELADEAITLVKSDGNLPLSVKNHKRVLLQILGHFASNERLENTLKDELEKRGFEVTVYQKETNFFELETVEQFKAKYDVVIYVANIENSSNQTTNRINWHTLYGLGNNLPWFAQELPTVLVSFGNPYHYYDAPMIQNIVNCYSNFEQFLTKSIEKITGESDFKGISPVDPLCSNRVLKELIK